MLTDNNWFTSKEISAQLLLAKKLVYDKIGFDCSDVKAEEESAEYGAFTFRINGLPVIYREAKITPTKAGQFVTIWKRKDKGPIAPFDVHDDFDFIIISAKHNHHLGQFIFSKAVLLAKGIISGHEKEGKRGIRVYPPWDEVNSSQAIKTQRWQLEYFLEISDGETTELLSARAKELFK